MILRLVFLVFFCGLGISASAQTTSFFVEDSIVDIIPVDGNKTKNFFFVKKETSFDRDLWLFNSIDDTAIEVDSDLEYLQRFFRNEEGVFYITEDYLGNIGNLHHLHFTDTTGNTTLSIPINEYYSSNPFIYRPAHAVILNDRLYVFGFYNQMNCVWESDGTTSGTQVIYQTSDTLTSLSSYEDHLLIVKEVNGNYEMLDYTFGQPAISFHSEPATNTYSNYEIVGGDQNFAYFNRQIDTGPPVWELWRTNFMTGGTSYYSEVNGNRVYSVTFKNDQVLYRTSYGNFLADTLTPSQVQTFPIKYEQKLLAAHPNFSRDLGKGFLNLSTLGYGQEIGYIAEDDSVRLLVDLAKGPKTSFPTDVNGFHVGNFDLDEPSYFITDDSVIYMNQTNGNDSSFYLYRHDGTTSESLIKMDPQSNVYKIFEYNGFVYWLSMKNKELVMLKRDLTQLDPPQPSSEAISENWFRQIGFNYDKGIVTSGIYPMYVKDVFLTESNEVICGGILGNDPQSSLVFSSDTSLVKQFLGSHIVAKYSTTGDLLWMNGIGGRFWSPAYKTNKMTVKSNGNVVVVGGYPGVGYFDNDSLEAPGAGIFIAELDGTTGNVISKQNITWVSNFFDFDFDGLIVDEYDNVYLAFMYENFNAWIGSVHLTAQKSPANAILRYGNDGILDWAKTIETPWLDNFGRTAVLNYDNVSKQITTVQNQRLTSAGGVCNYTTKRNFKQVLSADGVLLDTATLTTHDNYGDLSVGTYDENGHFFSVGNFRGSMSTGIIEMETPALGNCYEVKNFGITYNPELNEVVSATKSTGLPFYPNDIKKTNEGIYIFGKNWDDSRLVLKFTLHGELIGQKRLNQYSNQFEIDNGHYFDVNEDHIVFVGPNFQRDVAGGVMPFLNTSPSMSILKIANENWEVPEQWQFFTPDLFFDPEVVVFPNPFNETFTVVSELDGVKYTHYELFDLKGNLIQKGAFNEERLQEITVLSIAQGMYILNLTNETDERQVKMVRM